ncbi:MAG: cobalamin biosynthesis protein CobD [Clostridia bacterium]|jgi:adenosylcobinamide-phosphate synthase|nr:cobalamin biosynthesis protein CobD [Clostridia bacterium]
MTLWQLTLLSVLAGFLIDCAVGDPAWLPHPVVLIGKAISLSEKGLRRIFPKTDRGAFWAGLVMAILVPLVSAVVVFWILFGMWKLSPWAYFAASAVMSWQCLAARCLMTEANKVVKALETEGLDAGRKQVSMLVGRDTERLSEEQVLKATVETVAENASDGVIAPMLYLILFGAVGGFFYKAINTMDSMVGYKNDRYLFFGRAAAKLDDAANFLPARLSALAMIVAAPLVRLDGKNAFRIWKRDRRKHASPNSAQTESVAAGALHVQLAGPASYFGTVVEKPTIGDGDRPVERKDVARANRLMYGAGVLALIVWEAILLPLALFGGLGL